jgi:hypothetical protein
MFRARIDAEAPHAKAWAFGDVRLGTRRVYSRRDRRLNRAGLVGKGQSARVIKPPVRWCAGHHLGPGDESGPGRDSGHVSVAQGRRPNRLPSTGAPAAALTRDWRRRHCGHHRHDRPVCWSKAAARWSHHFRRYPIPARPRRAGSRFYGSPQWRSPRPAKRSCFAAICSAALYARSVRLGRRSWSSPCYGPRCTCNTTGSEFRKYSSRPCSSVGCAGVRARCCSPSCFMRCSTSKRPWKPC